MEDELIQLSMTDEDLKSAVQKALKVNVCDNLRERMPFVQFDSQIRGYLGEICMKKYLIANKINVVETDTYDSTEKEDKDIVIKNQYREVELEIKTSLIPNGHKTLSMAMKKCDIKIIKREDDYHNIKSDVYVQIYFNLQTQTRDDFLKTIEGRPKDYTEDQLIEILELRKLKPKFAGWVTKEQIVSYLDTAKQKTWGQEKKMLWKCPLTLCNPPYLLIGTLKTFN